MRNEIFERAKRLRQSQKRKRRRFKPADKIATYPNGKAERLCSHVQFIAVKKQTLTQHPLSATFPEITGEDYDSLRDDIRTHGQRDYITTHEGMVLDGWHRYIIAIELGKEPKLESLDSRISPVAFVLSRNLHRRHLNASQRAVAVASCVAWAPSSRPEIKVEPGSTLSTNAAMADAAKVSERTIRDAKIVVKKGRQEAVMNGTASVKSIARPAGKKKPKPDPEPTINEPDEEKNVLADFAADNERLVAENSALSASDSGREIVKLTAEIGALRGRINGLLAENKEAKSQAKYFQGIADALRKRLGVEKASGIVAAVDKLLKV